MGRHSKRRTDITLGTTFGNLVVTKIYNKDENLKYLHHNKIIVDEPKFAECTCNDCGSISIFSLYALSRHVIKACKICAVFSVDTNKKYGRCIIIKPDMHRTIENHGRKYVFIKCECGNIKSVNYRKLCSREIRSCGCLAHEANINRRTYNYDDETLAIRKKAEHIDARCNLITNRMFYMYGGRGITHNLGDTLFEMTENLKKIPGYFIGAQIDRIDNDGNYTLDHPDYGRNVWYDEYDHPCVGNLRWVTNEENQHNTFIYNVTTINLNSMYHMLANRLLPSVTFSRIMRVKHISIKEFIIVDFTKLHTHTTLNKELFLYVHKSLSDKLDYYINRIVGFYNNARSHLVPIDIKSTIHIWSDEELDNYIKQRRISSKLYKHMFKNT